MKNRIFAAAKVCFLLLFAVSSRFFAQVTISESQYSELCSKLVIVDAVWMSEGIIRADISLLDKPNSKPITGGYKKGDLITISSEPGCTYYIFSVTRSGDSTSKGSVTLTKEPPLTALQLCDETLMLYQNSSYAVDSLDWHFTSVTGDGGTPKANIIVSHQTALVKNLSMQTGSLFWLGECLYMLDKINMPSGEGKKDANGIAINGLAVMVFKKLNDYSSLESPGINGESINLPNFQSEFIIRKAALYKGKKPTKEELENTTAKIWLLEVFHKSGPIASRIIEITRNGKKIFLPFEPLRTFDSEEKALEYARQSGITDIELDLTESK